jgi:hypothetical protein
MLRSATAECIITDRSEVLSIVMTNTVDRRGAQYGWRSVRADGSAYAQCTPNGRGDFPAVGSQKVGGSCDIY